MSAYAPPPTRTSIPPGWVPPYQGPPPIPANLNVNQKQWNAGYWQFNSAFSNQHPIPQRNQIPWQMSQHFQRQHQQSAFNPYKKTVKEPSAEYMASKLSNNPLGLHGLVPVYVCSDFTLSSFLIVDLVGKTVMGMKASQALPLLGSGLQPSWPMKMSPHQLLLPPTNRVLVPQSRLEV